MSATPHTNESQSVDNATKEKPPFWAAPAVLSMIMISSGIFVWLLAEAIATFSSINY